ncbi:MAG TPA: STAS domain-containing protein [Burkholderiales bacterium]|nr:STAS domain-containing protein [Burkholderiales bacterium]
MSTTTTYTLSAEAGVRDIVETWAALRARLDTAESILELDAEALVRPDTALAQLLAVAGVRAREQGKSVKMVRPSQRLRELVSLLALDVVLGD